MADELTPHQDFPLEPIDPKREVQHVEGDGDDGITKEERMETAYVGLTKWQAMRKFWKACLFAYLCAFGVVMDGWENSFPGALRGAQAKDC